MNQAKYCSVHGPQDPARTACSDCGRELYAYDADADELVEVDDEELESLVEAKRILDSQPFPTDYRVIPPLEPLPPPGVDPLVDHNRQSFAELDALIDRSYRTKKPDERPAVKTKRPAIVTDSRGRLGWRRSVSLFAAFQWVRFCDWWKRWRKKS